MKSDKSYGVVIVGIVITLLLTAFAQTVISQADHSREAIPVFGKIPAFHFTERSGRPIDQSTLEGKITILDFFFTSCQGPCPMMARVMGSLHDYYVNSPQVQFISVSVDPQNDTLEVLKKYAEGLGVSDQRWLFLNGDLDDIKRLSEEGFQLPADELPYGHTIRFVLIDQRGQIRGYYDSSDDIAIEALKRNVRQLALFQR